MFFSIYDTYHRKYFGGSIVGLYIQCFNFVSALSIWIRWALYFFKFNSFSNQYRDSTWVHLESDSRFQVTKYKSNGMLAYFKNTQRITQEIDVKPEETMKKFKARAGQLGSMKKERIIMIQHSCTCNNYFTDILLEDISKDINVHIDFEHELMDSDNIKPTSEVNVMYEELRYKQLKENVMQTLKKS